jgi:hypothetical protein
LNENYHKLASETEAIDTTTLTALESQSAQLKYASAKTEQMDESVTHAQGAVSKKLRRKRCMRWIYAALAFVLLGGIAAVVFASYSVGKI